MRCSFVHLLVAAAAALGGAASARAQQQTPQPSQDGPVVVGERKSELKWFELPRVHAAVDGYWQYQEQSQSNPGQAKLSDRESLYQATLDLWGEAYVGHKNLLDVTGAFKLGIDGTNLESDTPGNSAKSSDTAFYYNVAGLLLQQGPFPVTLYGRKQQQNSSREFLSTVQTTTEEYGAVGQLRSTLAPTTVQLFHREEQQNDLLGTIDYSLKQDTAAVQSQAQITSTQRLEFSYEYDHVNEQQNSSFTDDYDRNDGTLVHQLNFGSSDQSNLRSSLRYYDQTGIYGQSDVRLDEQMHLFHSNTFSTQYDLTLDDREIQGQEQRIGRINASLAHQLFDSLSETAFIGASTEEIPDQFSSQEYFTGGAINYTKKVPFGRLNLSVGGALNRQNNSDQSSTVNISNEPHVFIDPFPVTLNRRNIVESSIVVTDTARVRVYQVGTDYTVQTLSTFTQLTRVVGGAITNGQAVLVSYQVAPEEAYTQNTANARFTARYSLAEGWLDGFSVYAIYRVQDQSVDAANPSDFVLDDFNEWRYGVDYHLGPVTLLAEQINYDSTVQPYNSTRFEARLDQNLGLASSLNLYLSHENVDYQNPDNAVTLNLARLDWIQRVTNDFDFIARLGYRDQTETIGGDTNGFEEVAEVRWHKRQTSAFATISNSSLSNPGGDTLSLTFTVGLRRDF